VLMPLAHGYGVVVGTFASFTREDPNDFGHWYHGKLRVSTPAGEYEAALDVDTPSGAGVSYRLVAGLSTSDFSLLAALGPGFTRLGPVGTSGALDYVRSPVLRNRLTYRFPVWTARWWGWLARTWLGRIRLTRRILPWVRSDGDNALDVLEPLLRASARIYVLGEPYTSGLGVHNVHLNQGDPPGPHQADDGIWQDGAVLCQDAAGAIRVWQVKFTPQSLRTDDAGLPS
jgi:hypothetical protein